MSGAGRVRPDGITIQSSEIPLHTTKRNRVVDIEKECSITHPTALGLLDIFRRKGLLSRLSIRKNVDGPALFLRRGMTL